MQSELDHGIRCDKHIGEVFRVRCEDCDIAAVEAAATITKARLRGECPKHPGYPLTPVIGCARCARDNEPVR